MTMAGPAITFSDTGFQIAPTPASGSMADGGAPDGCSNQYLPAGGYCYTWVQFSPVPSDAPNFVNGSCSVPLTACSGTVTNGVCSSTGTNVCSGTYSFYPITASLVAAGTENISGYQNILVTSTGVTISGTATPNTGSMLGASLLPGNPPAAGAINQYLFPSVYAGTPMSEPFTFSNLSTSPMTITSIILSDGADFSVSPLGSVQQSNPPVSGSSCILAASPVVSTGPSTAVNNGEVIVPPATTTDGVTTPGTCTLMLNFSTQSFSGLLSTGITVNGTMGGTTAPGPLAGAGASGTSNWGTVSIDPASVDFPAINAAELTYCESGCGAGGPPAGWFDKVEGIYASMSPVPATVTISNPTGSPATLKFFPMTCVSSCPAGASFETSNNCPSSLGAGNSCTLVLSLPTTLTNPACTSSDPLQYSFNIPITAAINGITKDLTVVAAATVNVVCTDNPYGLSITVAGTEQSSTSTSPAAPATGSITLSAGTPTSSRRAATVEAEKRNSAKSPDRRTPVRMLPVNPTFVQSTLSVGVGGFRQAVSVPLGTAINDAATMLAGQLNTAGSPVKAVANGPVVNLTSQTTGSGANLPLSTVVIGDYQATPSGNSLTGGKSAATTTSYDSGKIQVTTNGVTASAEWGSASTPQSIATALAAAINQLAGAYWKATASGEVVNLTSVSIASTTARAITNRRAITTARRASTSARGATEATGAETITPSTSNSITVTVNDSAGFTSPSFTATTD